MAKTSNLFPFVCGAVIVSVPLQSSRAAEAQVDGLRFFLAEQLVYDDNLFRLPDGSDTAALLGSGASRSDYLNRVSLGADARWTVSRQAFILNLRFDDNRLADNEFLNNRSGSGKAQWDWRLGNNGSGELGADYNRALAGFANTRFVGKDLLATSGVFWSGKLTVGTNWAIQAGARHAQTEHSAISRQFDDSSTDSGTAGIEYKTTTGATIGWSYGHTRGDFERLATLGGVPFDRDYEENSSSFRLRYALTGKLSLDASAGYLRREYPGTLSDDIKAGDFSGNVWEAKLHWQPTGKTAFKLSGWRKLRANLDAESDYFVAKGLSLSPLWNPTAKISVSMELSREEQDYLGSSVNFAVLEPRNDRVTAEQLNISYTPLQQLELVLTTRFEQRDSDRPLLQYDDTLVGFEMRLVY
jgi:exopolysaccharide biosynthesis operon protein EpsL